MYKLSSWGLLLSGFIRLLRINSPSRLAPTAWDTSTEHRAGGAARHAAGAGGRQEASPLSSQPLLTRQTAACCPCLHRDLLEVEWSTDDPDRPTLSQLSRRRQQDAAAVLGLEVEQLSLVERLTFSKPPAAVTGR